MNEHWLRMKEGDWTVVVEIDHCISFGVEDGRAVFHEYVALEKGKKLPREQLDHLNRTTFRCGRLLHAWKALVLLDGCTVETTVVLASNSFGLGLFRHSSSGLSRCIMGLGSDEEYKHVCSHVKTMRASTRDQRAKALLCNQNEVKTFNAASNS